MEEQCSHCVELHGDQGGIYFSILASWRIWCVQKSFKPKLNMLLSFHIKIPKLVAGSTGLTAQSAFSECATVPNNWDKLGMHLQLILWELTNFWPCRLEKCYKFVHCDKSCLCKNIEAQNVFLFLVIESYWHPWIVLYGTSFAVLINLFFLSISVCFFYFCLSGHSVQMVSVASSACLFLVSDF